MAGRLNDGDEYVTLPYLEYHQLVLEAGAWRLLQSSPHVTELLDEFIEWDRRKTLREASWAICSGRDWRASASAVSYAELERRRNLFPCGQCTEQLAYGTTRCPACGWVEPSGAELRARARASWAQVEEDIRRRSKGAA